MISLDIKNRLFTLCAKVVNIFYFNSKRLDIQKEISGEKLTILTITDILFI